MKLIHTADWHLGDRLGTIDRTDDIRRAIERVAQYCLERDADVLLAAGDIFSDRCTAEGLREALEHLNRAFLPFLSKGGTIVAITGNHDKENFCRTLWSAMKLAAPGPGQAGVLVPGGRLYLATGPTFFRLRDCAGHEVQFVLMPYPTEQRYLDEASQKYHSIEEKHRALQAAYRSRLRRIQDDPSFDKRLPAVLAAHVHVQGGVIPNLFRMTEQEDIIFGEADIPTGWAYVALGHIHKPQEMMGLAHVRYAGSIERLDAGERNDDKSVVLADIGPSGLRNAPETLPVEATPILDIEIKNHADDLQRLRAEHGNACQALVRCRVDYRPGTDDVNTLLQEIRAIFPRCYDLRWHDVSRPELTDGSVPPPLSQASMHDTVVGYLKAQLAGHKDLDEILRRAEALLEEVQA